MSEGISKTTAQIDWHSGFAGGLALSFRKYRADIEIEREHTLSNEPLRIDFMVIKKDRDFVIDNSVGRMFRKYNIIEYKNPSDALNIDVVWKCIGYAAIYKSLGAKVNEIPDSELTISIFRNARPRNLLQMLEEEGRSVDNPYPGIYRINGLSILPLQIVVPTELEEDDFRALRIMMPNADIDSVRAFLKEANGYTEKSDRLDADAVLNVSNQSNIPLFKEIKEDPTMFDSLRELMSEEFEEAENRGREQEKNSLIENMLRSGKTPEEISTFTGIDLSIVQRVQESLLQPA
ncbi:MAG: hypothetical protein IJT05_02590 [Lachnospiraceae bacterium]|nr:hypothetical protein [Lachnospiraceae bacterium]